MVELLHFFLFSLACFVYSLFVACLERVSQEEILAVVKENFLYYVRWFLILFAISQGLHRFIL